MVCRVVRCKLPKIATIKTFKLLTVILSVGVLIELPTEAPAQLTRITTSYVSDSAAVLPL
jgi:hypothetical protein